MAQKQLRVNQERPRQELTKDLPAWDHAFDEWSEMLARKGNSLERALGASVGPIIGCGAFGCVVESDPGKVIKLTSFKEHGGDDSELAFWTRMKREQERPGSPAISGIVKIDKVVVVLDKDTNEEYIAVLREDVEPLVDVKKGVVTPATTRREEAGFWTRACWDGQAPAPGRLCPPHRKRERQSRSTA